MLSRYDVPYEAEVVNAVIYLVDLSTFIAINFLTSFDLNKKWMTDYIRLRIFS